MIPLIVDVQIYMCVNQSTVTSASHIEVQIISTSHLAVLCRTNSFHPNFGRTIGIKESFHRNAIPTERIIIIIAKVTVPHIDMSPSQVQVVNIQVWTPEFDSVAPIIVNKEFINFAIVWRSMRRSIGACYVNSIVYSRNPPFE